MGPNNVVNSLCVIYRLTATKGVAGTSSPEWPKAIKL